ncbi:MAG TPA: DUF6204 family protein [Ilumatobacteraceae bacterium]|nr:DUF6204 family protein [Ilumatobacteraceae bacterium]HRB04609.1 DUF6204 family protein [Ilumatobacteraceae bacterium]
MIEQSPRVFRVTVRGRFALLSDPAHRYLAAAQQEHDIFTSAYTPEGTFTYDAKLDFFNLRYEIRSSADQPADDAAQRGMDEASLFLGTMKFGYRDLRVDVVDMTAMWDSVRR